MYTLVTLATSLVLSAAILLLLFKRTDATFYKVLRILTLVFCAVGFFRFMLADRFVHVINGAIFNNVHYNESDPLSAILRWGYFANYSVLPMIAFTKSRLFRNIACCYTLPFSILAAVYFERYMAYFTAASAPGISMPELLRGIYFALELILAISIVIILSVREKHVFRINNFGEALRFFIALPFVIFITMPAYVPQSIWGYTSLRITNFGAVHLIWFGVLAVGTLALYRIFCFRNKEDRYNLCLFLTIVLFFNYNSAFLQGFILSRLPIQLCNMAAYFYLIAIAFKLKRFSQFCFIVNITGTLIAIFSPDFSATEPGLSFWKLHFIYEHTLVLIIPILAMGLRIFPRVNMRSLKYSGIGFSCYFAFCMITGGLMNVFSNYTGQEVNYFYMFDIEKAESFVSFISFVKVWPVTLGAYTFYPMLFVIIFTIFSLLCFGFYYLALYCYRIEDDHLKLRNAGIDILERRLGRKTKIPREFLD